MAFIDIKQLKSPEEIEFADRDDKQKENMGVDDAISTNELNGLPYKFTMNEEWNCERKIDVWLMPTIIVTYGLQCIDKVILDGASQFGIVQDLDLYTIVGHDPRTHKPSQSLHQSS